jgi:hypothetical protein
MPKLEWYGQHYPPGNLILLRSKRARRPGMTKSIVCLFTVLTLFPLDALAKALDSTTSRHLRAPALRRDDRRADLPDDQHDVADPVPADGCCGR